MVYVIVLRVPPEMTGVTACSLNLELHVFSA